MAMKLVCMLIMIPALTLAGWMSPDGEWFETLPRTYRNTGNVTESWAISQGWQELTGEAADMARCVAGGGAWQGGDCVYPEQPPAPIYPPNPAVFVDGLISGGRIVAQGVDIEATTPDTGYILTDASTNKWLVTIADGEVIGVQISASPEVSMADRRALLASKRAGMAEARAARQVAVTAVKLNSRTAASAASAANSVPALRAQVAALAAEVERLATILEGQR